MTDDYQEFLRQKRQYGAKNGFEPVFMPDWLYDFQKYLVEWAVNLGRAAIFADCGLGKTPMQLTWAQNVVQYTNKPVLILAPLGVTGQTLDEAAKFDIPARRALPGQSDAAIIEVTNYEKLHHFAPAGYGGIVCDECFVADTPIDTLEGTRNICDVRPGDYVYTAAGLQKVKATQIRYSDSLVLTSTQGRDIISSANHLYFTHRGWVKAQDIQEGDYVIFTESAMRLVREAPDGETSPNTFSKPKEAPQQESFLRDILLGEMENDPAGDIGKGSFSRSGRQEGAQAQRVATVRKPGGAQGARSDPLTQSNLRPGGMQKDLAPAARDRAQAEHPGRQWQADAQTAKDTSVSDGRGLGSRIRAEFRPQDAGLSNQLQDRYCQPGLDDSHRGRRLQSYGQSSQDAGCQEGRQAAGARVDRVTIYKSDDPLFSRYRDSTGQVALYDLEMTGHPSFSVHGLLVHNSSILKNFDGKRRQEITEFMRTLPYRLLCTATAAPNDWSELGTSSEALGWLGQRDMLTRFFSRKAHYARDRGHNKEWNIRPWAEQGPFWQWLSSWARTARKPSDLDFDDDGFILTPMQINHIEVKAESPTPGMLFDIQAVGWKEEREAIRRTTQERCEQAAQTVIDNGATSMVWCNRNDEGDLLEHLIPGSVQVAGRHADEYKEDAARWFVKGTDDRRVLISKPSIFGFGLNFQHCQHMTYFPTWSYEQYYQATRRLWRFGQTEPVVVDLIYTNGGKRMLDGLAAKEQHATEMFENLVQHMHHELFIRDEYQQEKVRIPQWMTTK